MRGQLVEQVRTVFLMTLLSFYAAALSHGNEASVTTSQPKWLWAPLWALGTAALLFVWRVGHRRQSLKMMIFFWLLITAAVALAGYLDGQRLWYGWYLVFGVIFLASTLALIGLVSACMMCRECEEAEGLRKVVRCVAFVCVPLSTFVFLAGVIVTWDDIQGLSAQWWWTHWLLYLGLVLSILNTPVGLWALREKEASGEQAQAQGNGAS